jgi:hypothetical protein
MSKKPNWHANERVDKIDLEQVAEFSEGAVEQGRQLNILDNRSLVLNGFRVEVPNQTTYRGRIVIHGGVAYDYDGKLLFNEDQFNISRTVTLEGANTVFWVEIELIELDSDLDSRAFWDPTVDNGTDVSGDALPDGKESNATVSTRLTHDWRIVQPIRTGVGAGFERDVVGTLDSIKVPIIRLETDGSNKITATVNPNIALEAPRTTLLEQISTTQFRVVDSRLFIVGDTINLSEGAAVEEQVTISTLNYETNLITTTIASNTHSPGSIIVEDGATPRQIVGNALFGPYQRPDETDINDYKDRVYAGDERHGEILMRGHDSTALTVRSDTNLQTLKDQIDFLSAQIQEMKFGHPDPSLSKISTSRVPPGLVTSFPTTPRYFDDAGGIQGARTATVTVGDGVKSWGDYNAADETGIQAAFNALSSIGGTIVIKSGTYTLANDVVPATSSYITVIGESNTRILTSAGARFRLDGGGSYPLTIRNLIFQGSTSTVDGVFINSQIEITVEDCIFNNAQVDVNSTVDDATSFIRCDFFTDDTVFNTEPLIQSSVSGDLRGTFKECTFVRTTSPAALVGSCIESGGNGQVHNLRFFNCDFSDSGTPTSIVFIAGFTTVFRECRFNCTTPTTCIDVDSTTGFNNLTVLETSFETIGGSYLIARNSSEIVVKGVKNSFTTTANNLIFIDCDDVTVKDCLLGKRIAGGYTTLTEACIYITGTTVGAAVNKNYTISNNSFFSDADDATGIIFEVAGAAAEFNNVNISNNNFEQLETGIYMFTTPASGIIRGLLISGNQFIDRGTTWNQAVYQKVGILSDTKTSVGSAEISNNVFNNLNPPTSNTVYAEANRAAIAITNQIESSTVTGNTILRVGIATNYLAKTAGIIFGNTTQTVIGNNVIDTVIGEDVEGINLANTGASTSNDNIISNNFINNLASNAGICFGITGQNVTGLNVDANSLVNFSTVSGSIIGIGADTTSLVWQEISINNNLASGFSASVGSFVKLNINSMNNITINSNTIKNEFDRGIALSTQAGTTSHNIVISNNNLYDIDDSGIVVASVLTSLFSKVSVNSNVVELNSGGNLGIGFIYCNYVNASNNVIYTNKDNATGLNFSDCDYFVASNNIIRENGGTSSTFGIFVGSGSDIYSIVGNIIDSGSTLSKTIDSSNSAAGNGIVTLNLLDNAANGNALESGAGSATIFSAISSADRGVVY